MTTDTMSTPAKLRIVLGQDNCVKLTLPSGIPESVDSLKLGIQNHCGMEGDFRLQCMDVDFDDVMKLTSTADLKDKGTVKVITSSAQAASHSQHEPFHSSGDSSADTDILSGLANELPYSFIHVRGRDAAVKDKSGIPCHRQASEPKSKTQVRHFRCFGF